jgi:hypothetical protein
MFGRWHANFEVAQLLRLTFIGALRRLHSMSNPDEQVLEGILTPRQCARQKAELPFHLGGLNSLGQFFEDFIVTRDFSECGGSFVTEHSIKVGSTLKLADSTGFLSLIRIAWSRQCNEHTQDYGFAFVQPLEEQLDTAS